jgi:hypothetical protein
MNSEEKLLFELLKNHLKIEADWEDYSNTWNISILFDDNVITSCFIVIPENQ